MYSVYEVARAMLSSRNLLRRLGPVRASNSRIKQHFRARTEVAAPLSPPETTLLTRSIAVSSGIRSLKAIHTIYIYSKVISDQLAKKFFGENFLLCENVMTALCQRRDIFIRHAQSRGFDFSVRAIGLSCN